MRRVSGEKPLSRLQAAHAPNGGENARRLARTLQRRLVGLDRHVVPNLPRAARITSLNR